MTRLTALAIAALFAFAAPARAGSRLFIGNSFT